MAEWDESKHKRDRAGRFAEQEEKRQSLEKVYNSDLASGTGTQGQVPVPKAVGFNRSKTKHHQRHAAEMGLNEREYIQQSISFFNSNDGQLYFSERRERFYKYDTITQRLVVVSIDGIVHTYQFSSSKRFLKIKGQDELWEIK